MHEGMKPEAAGVEIATVLLLRQLYTLTAKLHGVDREGIGAWRDDVIRELRALSMFQERSEFVDAILVSAGGTVNGVFHTITDPRGGKS